MLKINERRQYIISEINILCDGYIHISLGLLFSEYCKKIILIEFNGCVLFSIFQQL